MMMRVVMPKMIPMRRAAGDGHTSPPRPSINKRKRSRGPPVAGGPRCWIDVGEAVAGNQHPLTQSLLLSSPSISLYSPSSRYDHNLSIGSFAYPRSLFAARPHDSSSLLSSSHLTFTLKPAAHPQHSLYASHSFHNSS